MTSPYPAHEIVAGPWSGLCARGGSFRPCSRTGRWVRGGEMRWLDLRWLDLRWLMAGLIALLTVLPADAALMRTTDVASTDAVLRWVNGYRFKPDPKSVPAAMRALSRFGAL